MEAPKSASVCGFDHSLARRIKFCALRSENSTRSVSQGQGHSPWANSALASIRPRPMVRIASPPARLASKISAVMSSMSRVQVISTSLVRSSSSLMLQRLPSGLLPRSHLPPIPPGVALPVQLRSRASMVHRAHSTASPWNRSPHFWQMHRGASSFFSSSHRAATSPPGHVPTTWRPPPWPAPSWSPHDGHLVDRVPHPPHRHRRGSLDLCHYWSPFSCSSSTVIPLTWMERRRYSP